MKKRKILFLIVALLFSIIVATLFVFKDKLILNNNVSEKTNTQEAFKEEYIKFADLKRILNNNENAVVVFTQLNCVYCDVYKEIIKELENTELIYFYILNENSVLEDMQALEKLNIQIVGTPTTIFVKNNQILEKVESIIELSELKEKMNSYFGS